MRDGLHHPSLRPWGALACQRWNAPAHLTLAERKQIPQSPNREIALHRLDATESCELRLWFEHLILQIQRDSHNTDFSDVEEPENYGAGFKPPTTPPYPQA